MSAGDGRRHAGGHPQRLLAAVFGARAAATSRRANWKHCGRLVEPVRYARETGRYTPITWDEALETHRGQTSRHAARRNVLVLQRPQLQRSRLSAATLRPALRHEQRQQLQLLLPSGERRRARAASPAAARRRSSSKTWSTPTCVFVIGGNPASNHPRLMRTLMHVRRRGGQVIVDQPGRRNGPRQFSVPSDVRSLLFGSRDRQPVRPAAHRRRPRAAHRRRQADRRDGRARRSVSRRSLPRLARARSAARKRVVGRDRREERRRLATRSTRSPSDMPRRRTSSSAGRWASRTTRMACNNVQAIANLALLRGMVGRPGCGLHADPRPLERAGHRLRRRHAEAQGRDLRPAANALRRQAADHARPRHDGLHGRRRSRRAESSASASAAICTARIPTPRSRPTSIGKPRPDRLSEHDAQHRPRPRPGQRDDHPAGARPRRRAAADDAGVDVQLRPPERRRPAAARGPAQRSRRHRLDRRQR